VGVSRLPRRVTTGNRKFGRHLAGAQTAISATWTGRLLLQDHLRISYTLDGAKDNPARESFISRFKNETIHCCWMRQRLRRWQRSSTYECITTMTSAVTRH
jgi:hypothetical protein